MTNRDEDDKEEKWPEELYDELNLVSPAVCYVLPEQEEKLSEKSHRSKQLPGHDAELSAI